MENRDYEIVTRRANRETLQSIGDSLGLTREGVRQIFEKHATPEQKAQSRVKPIRPPKESDRDMDMNEPKTRLNITMSPSQAKMSQRDIRAGIRAWLASKTSPNKTARTGRKVWPENEATIEKSGRLTYRKRKTVIVPSALHDQMLSRARSEGVTVTDVVRHIAARKAD